MKHHSGIYTDQEGRAFYSYEWIPDSPGSPRGIVQIVHGMMEHAGRYAAFAEYLAQKGFMVVAEDHPGHGRTAVNARNLGHLDGKKGWHLILDQIHFVMKKAREKHPDIPYVLMGHSMGSMLARHATMLSGSAFDGLILSGLDHTSIAVIQAGKMLANGSSLLYGKHYRNRLINYLAYQTFNNHFKPSRTAFDWLSTDNDQVDRYVADPHSGYSSTSGFYQGMFHGLDIINQPSQLSHIPDRLPVLILAGEKDPVGKFSKGPLKVAEQLKNAGLTDITVKLYPEGRHEMLNETNQLNVFNDISDWIEQKSRVSIRGIKL